MQINLADAISKESLNAEPLGTAPTVYEQIVGARAILSDHHDTTPNGPPVLVPFPDQVNEPGLYQVWFPVCPDAWGGDGQWVHVNPLGEIERIDYLPSAYEMRTEHGE